MLFATDADGELKIPIREAATYRTLYEGHPARLRKCKVMVKVFGRTHWFLVTTRYSDGGARNRSIYETMGFAWNGPVTAMRLEKRGKCTPAGILSSEHHQAAVAAIERFVIQLGKEAEHSPSNSSYLEVMSAEMSRPDEGKWRKSIIDSDSDP